MVKDDKKSKTSKEEIKSLEEYKQCELPAFLLRCSPVCLDGGDDDDHSTSPSTVALYKLLAQTQWQSFAPIFLSLSLSNGGRCR